MLQIKQKENTYIVSFFNVSRLNLVNTRLINEDLQNLVKQPNSRLIFNLQGITFVDSSAFQRLIDVVKYAHSYGSEVTFMNVSEEVKELINLVEATDLFHVIEYSEEYN